MGLEPGAKGQEGAEGGREGKRRRDRRTAGVGEAEGGNRQGRRGGQSRNLQMRLRGVPLLTRTRSRDSLPEERLKWGREQDTEMPAVAQI